MRRRHNRIDFPGSIHFVTTVASVRGSWFVDEDVCRKILLQFEKYRIRNRISCYGYVLMPDHLHALLQQDTEGVTVADLMRDFKRETSKRLKLTDFPQVELWSQCYDDVPVPGTDAAMTKLVYMLNNPVRRGIVSDACDYPWSSARDHYELGRGIVTVARI